MDTQLLTLKTGARLVTDITRDVASYVNDKGDGLVHVFAPHATAGLALMETGAGSEPDLELILAQLLPIEDIYRHRHGSPGHGRDHVLPALICPSLTVPVQGGRLLLGTWQSIIFVDPNGDNPSRQARLSFLAG